MSGRGRGATLPAWMTTNGSIPNNVGLTMSGYGTHQQVGQFEDQHVTSCFDSNKLHVNHEVSHVLRRDVIPIDNRNVSLRRSRSRSFNIETKKRSESPQHQKSCWKPKKIRTSNFDIKPPEGMELPPIGVNTPVNGVPNSFLSYANNPVAGQYVSAHGASNSNSSSGSKADQNTTMMLTRHARRIYAGGIPSRATEAEIQTFFDDIVCRALAPVILDCPPVNKVYLNIEKCYAFVEFNSIELTTACMQLDGVKFDHYSGSTTVRVRRPNDYRPETLPFGTVGPTPFLNLGILGGMGASGTGGPGKVFVGGLPYNLADEQIMELLSAFGPIKQFHQVREPGSLTSKGYAFCEYMEQSVAEAAISGLNGLQLGEKTLSVRIASAANNVAQIPNIGCNAVSDISSARPTKVLKLSNMVTHEDLQSDSEVADIKEDVRLECADHGTVLSVLIPRVKDGHHVSLEGLIFVEFVDSLMSTSAALVLNGRKFADKTVVVNYFDEAKFSEGIYN